MPTQDADHRQRGVGNVCRSIMMRKLTLSAIALAATTMIGSTVGHANLLLVGSLWENQASLAANATIAGGLALESGGTAPTVTFRASDLNFHTDRVHRTIGDWLASASATCLTGCTHLTDLIDNTYTLYSGDTGLDAGINHFSITHDDGVQLNILSIPGLEVNAPTTASTENFVVNVPVSGNYHFLLSYGECCGPPARLLSDLPEARVPEPASLALLGSALAGFGVMRRRRKKV